MTYPSRHDADEYAVEKRPLEICPDRVRLEASTFCQLKCPTCSTASGELYHTIRKGFLTEKRFREFVDANPWVKEIEISNFGEVFLNPHLENIFKYAFEHDVRLTILAGANLNHVRGHVLESLVKYQVRAMRCSIDGASPETYAQYRVGGNFDQVIENIEAINAHKKAYGTPYPHLVWQFVVFGHNEHEIATARKMAARLGMEFEPKLNWDEDFSPVRDEEAVRRQIDAGAASRSEYRKKTGRDYMEYVCDQMWQAPQINWDGSVLGCCRNQWQPFSKNVFEDGLIQALNSEDMTRARAMLVGEAEPHPDVPCTSCRIYKDMRRKKRFLKKDATASD